MDVRKSYKFSRHICRIVQGLCWLGAILAGAGAGLAQANQLNASGHPVPTAALVAGGVVGGLVLGCIYHVLWAAMLALFDLCESSAEQVELLYRLVKNSDFAVRGGSPPPGE